MNRIDWTVAITWLLIPVFCVSVWAVCLLGLANLAKHSVIIGPVTFGLLSR